jgi:hypothetical protein
MRILFLLMLLAGCAELQLAPDPVDPIVAEAISAARAPAVEQKAALGRAQQAFVKDTSSINRLRLAMLLAMLPAPFRDDARASELLEPIADAGSPGIGRFAAFLAPMVTERQRVSRDLDRISREKLSVERDRAAADRERDKREEALKQQLEALRSIERGILEREDRMRRQKVRP